MHDDPLVAAIREEHPFLRTVPPDEVASFAARRWSSYRRRHPKSPSDAERVLDLAKGLRDHYEVDASLGGGGTLREYEDLARRLAPLLRGS